MWWMKRGVSPEAVNIAREMLRAEARIEAGHKLEARRKRLALKSYKRLMKHPDPGIRLQATSLYLEASRGSWAWA